MRDSTPENRWPHPLVALYDMGVYLRVDEDPLRLGRFNLATGYSHAPIYFKLRLFFATNRIEFAA